jgi:hypothetical protein
MAGEVSSEDATPEVAPPSVSGSVSGAGIVYMSNLKPSARLLEKTMPLPSEDHDGNQSPAGF